MHSLSFSMNSSLHGSHESGAEEHDNVRSSFSSSKFTFSPSLSPPPVDIEKERSFECEICGELVTVIRRLNWK